MHLNDCKIRQPYPGIILPKCIELRQVLRFLLKVSATLLNQSKRGCPPKLNGIEVVRQLGPSSFGPAWMRSGTGSGGSSFAAQVGAGLRSRR